MRETDGDEDWARIHGFVEGPTFSLRVFVPAGFRFEGDFIVGIVTLIVDLELWWHPRAGCI